MKKEYSFYIILLISLLGMALISENLTAQEQGLCVDYSFSPFKRNKKPPDTTCTVIENGFMYTKADEIIKLSGLPMNFIVCKTSGVQNAFAFMDKGGNRYIKYDNDFMMRMNTDSSAVESTIILAHEIGHHVFFHTINNASSGFQTDINKNVTVDVKQNNDSAFRQEEQEYYEMRRRQELEADRFAGFIMARKGISFEKGETFYKKLDGFHRVKDDSTHPLIEKRIQALKEGFDLAGTVSKTQPINLSVLGKQNTTIVYKKTSKLDRDNLLYNVADAIRAAQYEFANGKYALGIGTGMGSLNQLDTTNLRSLKTYLGRDFSPSSELIDDEKDYFQVMQSNFSIQNSSPNASFSYHSAFHIRDGNFFLILFIPGNGVKVAYKSRFEKGQISFDEIKLLFSQIFKPLVQKLFDNYSQ